MQTPVRVRLSTRRAPPFEAGTFVRLKARLLPPAHASLPGGYDFARDAWFARIGAVGNVLGRIEVVASPVSMGLRLGDDGDRSRPQCVGAPHRFHCRRRGGRHCRRDGHRQADLLSDEAKEIIREAGIFHIITISGVQMTLVAAIFFVGLRRLLALSPDARARLSDQEMGGGFRDRGRHLLRSCDGLGVGTERALFMTVIMLASVLLDRQALTMRNLAIAAALVILIQPEAIMGASFQLSFAAVAALVAVYEARMSAAARATRRAIAAARPSTLGAHDTRVLEIASLAGPARSVIRDLLRDLGHRLFHGL